MDNDVLSKINFSPSQVRECFENNGFVFSDEVFETIGEVVNYKFKALKVVTREHSVPLYYFCAISYATIENYQVLKIYSNHTYKSDRNLNTIVDCLNEYINLKMAINEESKIFTIMLTYVENDFILFDNLKKLDTFIKMMSLLTEACAYINVMLDIDEAEIKNFIDKMIANDISKKQ